MDRRGGRGGFDVASFVTGCLRRWDGKMRSPCLLVVGRSDGFRAWVLVTFGCKKGGKRTEYGTLLTRFEVYRGEKRREI